MTPDYLKTKNMAQKLGYSTDFLLNNRNLLFFEGEHFFTKDNRIDWKVSRMIAWVENLDASTQVLEILRRVS